MRDLIDQVDAALRVTMRDKPAILFASVEDLKAMPWRGMDGIHPLYKGIPMGLSGWLERNERFRVVEGGL